MRRRKRLEELHKLASREYCANCQALVEIERLRDALAAANDLLLTLGAERAAPTSAYDELTLKLREREGAK